MECTGICLSTRTHCVFGLQNDCFGVFRNCKFVLLRFERVIPFLA